MKKSIKWIRSFNDLEGANYGGRSYNKATYDILRQKFDFSFFDVFPKTNKNYFESLLEVFINTLRIKGKSDIWVRDYFATIPLLIKRPRQKNVVFIQHIASTSSSIFVKVLFKVYNYFFYTAIKKADAVITISDFWRKHFLNLGIKNVYTVFPFIDTSSFNISDSDVENFKNKYNLNGKPIIYLGNCRSYKGVRESYNLLKDLDVHFITSGFREVELPCLHLDLSYIEYLCLLKSCDVVLFMSLFEEGWGLTAHEAMFLRTPVIGSGLGGNKELLEGGDQIVSSFADLKFNVLRVLGDKDLSYKMGNSGYAYAKTFTKKRFEDSWVSVVQDILRST